MAITTTLSQFFLSEWLWSFTWDLWHIPLAMLFMFILTYFFTRMSLTQKIFLSCTGPLVAFFSFQIIIVTVFIYSIGFNYEPDVDAQPICTILANCLWLDVIYSILQISYYTVLHYCYSLKHLKRLALLTVIAHTSAACLMDIFISWYYK